MAWNQLDSISDSYVVALRQYEASVFVARELVLDVVSLLRFRWATLRLSPEDVDHAWREAFE